MNNESIVTHVSVVTFADIWTEKHHYQVYPDGRVKMWTYLGAIHNDWGWDWIKPSECPEEYDSVKESGLKALNGKITHKPTIRDVSPDKLRVYLIRNGWKKETSNCGGIDIFIEPNNPKPFEIYLPKPKVEIEEISIMLETFRVLCCSEGRSVDEIVSSVMEDLKW